MKGLHFVSKRTPGKPIRWYVYAWRGGPLIARREGGAKPQLTADDLRAALDAIDASRRPDPRVFRSLINEWRVSEDWRRLASSTRATWGFSLDHIEQKWGETPLTVWNDPRMVAKVVAWRDSRVQTPRAADIGVTVLSRLLEFGRLRAKVTVNVAAGIPGIYRGADRAEIVWTEEDMEQFSCAAIALNRPHVIDGLWLATLTGMRREDLVGLTWDEVGDQAIVRLARKKSKGKRRRAAVPLIPPTRILLDELRSRDRSEGVKTVLVNSKGKPWTPASFTQAFNHARDLAEIVYDAGDGEAPRSKHLHDCRGSFVTHLCRCGLTNQEIARIVAWSPENVEQIRRTYVDDAAVVVALGERISNGLL